MSVISIDAQERFLTRTGYVKFFSSALIEDITANNNEVLSIIDIKKNEVAVDIPIKSFVFRKKLMQEHFNENYMESEQFPKATFKGTFDRVNDLSNRIEGTYSVNAKGELTIHGVTKSIEVPVEITVGKNGLSANLIFDIAVKEYDVKIPKLMFKKIAEVVEVTGKFEYSPYN
jgi:polyisoprenoid-binding protein YceI